MQNRIFCTMLIIFVFSTVFSHQSFAKEYAIPTIRIEANIQPDGSIRIIEHRTYVFEGSFSWADYRLPLKGFTEIKDIRIAEGGINFINKNNEKPGTFQVLRSNSHIQIKWFYEADDEKRTFTISYTLDGAMVHGPKWSEFFWNYISSGREKDTGNLKIQMILPQTVTSDSLYSWARGPQSKISLKNTAKGYRVTATNLDDDEIVKIRSVFPRSVFDSSAVFTSDLNFTLEQARAEENAHQKAVIAEQKKDARLAGYGRKLFVIVSVLSIGSFLFFFLTYGRPQSASHVSSTETIMIPGREKPAVIGWLLQNRVISSAQLMATLLDLARRGYFHITEQEPKKGWFGREKKVFTIEEIDKNPTDELTGWEASLAAFVTKQINQNNNRIDKLFSANSYSTSKWFTGWKKQLKEYCQTKDWYDDKSYKGVYANIGIQLALACVAVLATEWAGLLGGIPIMLTLALLGGSIAIVRRTEEGEKIYTRWNAYKKGLKNAEKYSIGSDLLDRHFIHAVAFGLSKNNIRTILERSDNFNTAIPWVVVHGHPHTFTGHNIADSLSTLSATGTTAFPGTAGTIGASAGIAGGGAAGGAG